MIAGSGDWAAITPWHPRIGAVRAIEYGFALMRPVRNGQFIASDQRGQILVALDYFNTKEKVLATQVPMRRSATLYPIIGDSGAWLAIGVFLTAIMRASWHGRRGALRRRVGVAGQEQVPSGM